jgi:hypothetical protein
MRRSHRGLLLGLLVTGALYALFATHATALTTAPPEGWVVLPLDEYKALRERAVPPAEKGRAGDDAPTFVVGLVYLHRVPGDAWIDKGRARIDLPALDLPVSRTGVELFYSPRFRVEPQAGAFRVEAERQATSSNRQRSSARSGFGCSRS